MLQPFYHKDVIEAGCDEAGRGCLAGPVFAAAVILPQWSADDDQWSMLNDSKQLSEKKRYALREVIEREALAWAVGIVTNEEIDRINILRASILAMHRALDELKLRPEEVIVDGNRFTPYNNLPYTTKALRYVTRYFVDKYNGMPIAEWSNPEGRTTLKLK